MLITHEMGVIREICDRVVVLEQGGSSSRARCGMFGNPQHDVSQTLLAPLQHGLAGRTAKPSAPHSHCPPTPPWCCACSSPAATHDEPDLAALFKALGGRVRLLQGGVERIQGHALGQLLLAVNGSPHSAEELRNRACDWAQRVEVLGHVV